MTDKRKLGIGSLLVSRIKAQSREEVDEELFEITLDAGKNILSLKENEIKTRYRNGAGGRGKAAKFLPLKKKASALYDELKHKLGKNPPWKVFIAELEAKFPEEWKDGKDGGVNDWWKELNKGESIF